MLTRYPQGMIEAHDGRKWIFLKWHTWHHLQFQIES